MKFRLSIHALGEAKKRKIPIPFIEAVLEQPEQIIQQDSEVTIYQSKIDFGTGKLYLLRVFINTTVDPAVVITLYRTSQIKKYWRNP
ncbi:DUF4258 domain-containing protein [Spirulina major]|uniref:DUF4258 domain-containing protein n=1 Tax=Spirulina major TaxID=270636 RepID=UPI000933356B|nr:DUF4258 domain-containing protein [Spirulina major]